MDVLLTASPDLVAELGTGTLKTWITDNIIVILVLVAGCAALFAGSIGKVSKVVTIFAGVVLALLIVGIGVGSAWEPISKWLPTLIGA